MKIEKKRNSLIRLINKIGVILPVFFWTFLVFGFEEPIMGVVTIGSALIHEVGHIFCILASRVCDARLKGVVSGFRIKTGSCLSYDEEIAIYLGGPAANFIIFIFFSLLSIFFGEVCALISIINLATALSNLLPIEGYDGYGIIKAIINKRESNSVAMQALSTVSSSSVFILCIFSLYLIDRQGGGYWIFGIFFISMIKHIKLGLGE